MRYSLCANVSIEEICGTYLLIASGDAIKKLDYIRTLNETGAEILSMVQDNMDTEEIIYHLASEYDKKIEDIKFGVIRFLDDMESKGYLVPETEERNT